MKDISTIATWFVADDPTNATYFPQIGASSDKIESQIIYWRCTVVFFASSLWRNPSSDHVFYTNADLPEIDGISLSSLFSRWGVRTVKLPVSYRLPPGRVKSWGNQFYVFDVLQHFTQNATSSRLVLLDSDCIWMKSASEMESAIDRHRALTYQLDGTEHKEGEAINGLTREQLAKFVGRNGGPERKSTPYFGGEFYAATSDETARIVEQAMRLWPSVYSGNEHAPLEEAHLLSAIYAILGIEEGTANSFVRRMWTLFHYNDLRPEDAFLTIWHLPAEKRTGFVSVYTKIIEDINRNPRTDGRLMGLDYKEVSKSVGFPRRGLRKLQRDLTLKLIEKLGIQ